MYLTIGVWFYDERLEVHRSVYSNDQIVRGPSISSPCRLFLNCLESINMKRGRMFLSHGRMRTYSDACWRMLTPADLRRCRLSPRWLRAPDWIWCRTVTMPVGPCVTGMVTVLHQIQKEMQRLYEFFSRPQKLRATHPSVSPRHKSKNMRKRPLFRVTQYRAVSQISYASRYARSRTQYAPSVSATKEGLIVLG
jgi:hypothetical protein